MPVAVPPLTWRGGLVGIYQPVPPFKGQIILIQGHNRFEGSLGREAEDLRPTAVTFSRAGYVVFCLEMPPEPHKGRVLAEFLEAPMQILDKYGECYVVGLSGGGWTTSVLAAHDSRVIKGYSVAGDGPLDVWPDQYDEAHLIADYRALYEMADDRLLHIYNASDPCCFGWQDTNLGYLHVWDVSHSSHAISPWAAEWILEDME